MYIILYIQPMGQVSELTATYDSSPERLSLIEECLQVSGAAVML